MTVFQKVETDITRFKPKMKSATKPSGLKDLRYSFTHNVAQVKADGEFNYIKCSREGETYALNRFGRKTTGLPALEEMKQAFMKWNFVEMEALAEIYAVDKDGKPLSLPNLIHFLKGTDHTGPECKDKPCYRLSVGEVQNFVHVGFFELLSLNGKRDDLIYPLKYEMLRAWCNGCKLVGVLEWTEFGNMEELQRFWHRKVEVERWEGMVIRSNGDIWKIKPRSELDAVVIGINKGNKGFEEGKARSLKLALMNEDGSFVEIGDCSGIGEEEAEQVFGLMDFKVGEDNQTVFVQPILIATIEYNQIYEGTKNKVYSFEKGFREAGEQTLIRMRNPHVIRYREDKKVCTADIGLIQIS